MKPSIVMMQRFLTEKFIRFAAEEGIIDLLESMRQFDMEAVLKSFQNQLGYKFQDSSRIRMIMVLLDLLCECGYVRRDREQYSLGSEKIHMERLLEEECECVKRDFKGQIDFFEKCIGYVGIFLKGGRPLYGFDDDTTHIWEDFLGNSEFRFARSVLINILFSVRGSKRDALSVLDLCYGPGFDMLQMLEQFPNLRLTAIDFKGMFFKSAASKIPAESNVQWIPPSMWTGFGTPLPFNDRSFDNVFFACADPYIPGEMREYVYRDIYRILKQGGSLGILTRSYPDAGKQYVKDTWIRRGVCCHDFTEGVCEGWHGFSDALESISLFNKIGYAVDTVMMNASVWRLDKI